ncbi:MAG: AraC family transcriptional regulator [Prolixibacteraceae bacterium]|nr:AraC family transcriptional regulator [Prolixibacteraceae bacterium]
MAAKIFISIILLTVSVSLFSQNTKIDSLQQKLTIAKGHERILVLNDLAFAYGYVDTNKSIDFAKEALRLAETLEYNKATALTYDILGRAYFISGDYKAAEEYYNKCLLTANKYGTKDDVYKALRHKTLLYLNGFHNDSTESLPVFKQFVDMTIEKRNYADFLEILKIYIYVFNNQQSTHSLITKYLAELMNRTKSDNEFQAAIYASEGFYFNVRLDFFSAIEKYGQALKLTKEVPFKVNSLERIGSIYFEIRRYKESVKYYDEALLLAKNNEFESKKLLLYLIEADLGASHLQLKDYKTALQSLKNALVNPYFSNRDKATILNNLGVAYLSVDSLDKADLYINEAISIINAIKDADAKLAFLNSKAELLIKSRAVDKKIKSEQLIQLLDIMNEISKLANDVKDYYVIYDSYQLLSDYYGKSGNYKKSNEYLKKWVIVNDSINNREFVNKMSEFRFKYDTEKKEQQINTQQIIIEQKDKLIVLSVIAGSFIFAALLVIFILYRIRNKAYRILVYQSLENTGHAQLVKMTNITDEDDPIVISNSGSALDEELKNQIDISLNKQLDLKVYLEPNLLLKTLAERCDTNRSYLSQFINERYSMNFNTFINMLRINEAKKIISDRNNDIPLKELYLRLGFNTYSVFNEAFKRSVGVTPNFYFKTVNDLFDASNL